MCSAPQDVVLEALCAPLLSNLSPVQALHNLQLVYNKTVAGLVKFRALKIKEKKEDSNAALFLEVLRRAGLSGQLPELTPGHQR
jgi:hypothetical protein